MTPCTSKKAMSHTSLATDQFLKVGRRFRQGAGRLPCPHLSWSRRNKEPRFALMAFSMMEQGSVRSVSRLLLDGAPHKQFATWRMSACLTCVCGVRQDSLIRLQKMRVHFLVFLFTQIKRSSQKGDNKIVYRKPQYLKSCKSCKKSFTNINI